MIVALDLPDRSRAEGLVRLLGRTVSFYKVGLELYVTAGPDLIEQLLSDGKQVFLDLKFYDVPETVQRAVSAAEALGVDFMTVHGNAGILSAAAAAKKEEKTRLLAVTVLTSLDQDDLSDLGYPCTVPDLVLHRAQRAKAMGLDGVIASGEEAGRIRKEVGKDFLIVTPGIRPEGIDRDDHKRASSPRAAIEAGADYLVVGRPIRDAADPHAAARDLISEIQEAFDRRSQAPS